MNKRTWIIFAVIVVGLLTALVITSHNATPQIDASKIDPNKIQAASPANGNIADHVFGTSTGKVTLIEYGDFECPYCGQVYPQLKTITQEYSDDVVFIFRNFPLTTIHPNARAAAAAVEAAGLQGKYWQMHDIIYENQSEWENLTGDSRTNAFVGYASSIGVDIKKFDAALADGAPAINQKIAYDQAIGTKLNVDSTPSIYLDGTLVGTDVDQDLETGTGTKLKAELNAALKKAGVTLPAGES